MNSQTMIFLNCFILVWGIDFRTLFTRRQCIFLSGVLFFSIVASLTFSYKVNLLIFLIYLTIRFYMLLTRFNNWLTPLLSFLLKFTILAFLWMISFDLPELLFHFNFLSSSYLKLILICSQSTFLILFSQYFTKAAKKMDIINMLNSIKKKYKYFSLTVISMYLFIFIVHLLFYQSQSPLLFIISFIPLFTSASLLSVLFYFIAASYRKDQEYHILSLTLSSIKEKYEQTHEFRHDYKGILLSLNGYLEAGQVEEATNYVHSIIDYSTNMLIPEYYTQLSLIPLPPVQSVLASFGEKALEQNVDFILDIRTEISYINMELIDFIRCLTILINNAFEGATKQKKHTVYVTMEKKDNYFILNTKNEDYSNTPLNKLLKRGFSSKANHSGNGLNIVTGICDNYIKASFDIKRIDNVFVTTLSISY